MFSRSYSQSRIFLARANFRIPPSLMGKSWSSTTSSTTASKRVIIKSDVPCPLLDSDEAKLPVHTFIMRKFLHPDRKDLVAIMDASTGASVTYGDLFYYTTSMAESLEKKLGVKKNDRVAIISPNHLHFFTTFMGISLVGAVSTCMNPLSSVKEMTYQIEKTGANYVFVHPMCLETALKVVDRSRIIVMDASSNGAVDGMLHLGSLISPEPLPQALRRLDVPKDFDPHSLLTIPFSSGTTGRSKGVMLTHRNLVSNVLQVVPLEGQYLEASETQPRGTLLCPLPFFHIYGLTAGILVSMNAGAKLIFMPSFDLQLFLQTIQDQRVTRAFVVPPIVLALAKHPIIDRYDLSSVKCLMSGAAPLGEDVQVAAAKRLNCLVKQAWGMTETSPCGAITPDYLVTSVEALKGTSGKLAPGTEAKIVDPSTGEDLDYTSTGELLVRGPQIMAGYLDDPESTKAALEPDGWLHTGDIGHFDEDGWMYITDRLKELIKYKGMQVPPAELEAVLNSMPEVKDAIVIPVPDAEAGELPRAYVVKQDGVTLTEAQVMQFVSDHVAPYKRLRGGVIFIDSVPKSTSGKLLRRVMIDIDRQQSGLPASA
eukprot:gene9935-10985_t